MPQETPPPRTGDVLSQRWERLALRDAEAIMREIYGIAGTAQPLSSERDETFRIAARDGRAFTLKVAGPAEDAAALRFQDDVLLHLAATAPGLPVPRVVPALQGGSCLRPDHGPARGRIVRLLTYLEGEQQHRTQASAAQAANIGRMLAALAAALAGFGGRPPRTKLLWDISNAMELAELTGAVDPARRPAIAAVLDEYARAVPPLAGVLRRQVIHNDFNPHNILIDPAAPTKIAGIIDFGDMVFAPLVNDIAVAAAYHLAGDDWAALAGALIAGFHGKLPLRREEADVLPVLIKARLATTIVIGEWRAADRPLERDYILRNHAAAWRGLQRLSALSPADLARLVPGVS